MPAIRVTWGTSVRVKRVSGRARHLVGIGVGLALASVAAPAMADDRASLFDGARVEFGGRVWLSAPRLDNRLFDPNGTPASRLLWDGGTSTSLETFFRFDLPETGLFVKGFVGGGLTRGGSLDDEDYAFNVPIPGGTFSGTFLDTYLKGAAKSFGYAVADVGLTVPLSADLPVRLGVFVGGVGSVDEFLGRGVRCNPDDAQNLLCPLDAQVVPLDRDVIAHETRILGARIGVEAMIALPSDLFWRVEAAYVAGGSFALDDGHLLRTATPDPASAPGDPANENALGPAPNIVSNSTELTGLMLESELTWRLADRWSVSAGARYWTFDSGSAPVTFGARLPPPFRDTTSTDNNRLERFGLFTSVSYRF